MLRRAWTSTKLLVLTCAMTLVIAPAASSQSPQPEAKEASLSGRIAFLEGQLLIYPAGATDWAPAGKDTPFRADDVLFCERNGKAELLLLDNTLVRIDAETEVQLVTLNKDLVELDIDSGAGRFVNKGTEGQLKVTTEFGDITAPPGTAFDLYVDDVSLEVIAIKGRVEFLPEEDPTKREVAAGTPSLITDGKLVSSGEGKPDAQWDAWNQERDAALEKK